MNPELQFLINCCQTSPAPEIVTAMRSQLTAVNSVWLMTTGQLAHSHGVFPLFHQSLKSYAADLIPQEILQRLQQQYLDIVRHNMMLSAELIRIMKLLADNNIAALAFKGPTLAQMAYGNIALREYGDLDVLVQKKDIYQVDSLLKTQGYQRYLKLTPSQEKIWFDRAHDLGLYHPDKSVHFEMHWSLMNEDHPIHLEFTEIWDNPNPVTINQQAINTFANEELLIYLCVHGSKHLWERIEWIKDIDLLARSEEIDWNKILEKVKGSDFEIMFFLGLYLSRRLFTTEFPHMITERMAVYKELPNLYDAIIAKKWSDKKSGSLISNLSRTYTMLQLFPYPKMRLLYLHNIFLKPSFNEYWLIDLPESLHWFYYFIRPFMLAKKYLKNWCLAKKR